MCRVTLLFSPRILRYDEQTGGVINVFDILNSIQTFTKWVTRVQSKFSGRGERRRGTAGRLLLNYRAGLQVFMAMMSPQQ